MRRFLPRFLSLFAILIVFSEASPAAILYESGTLGPTGLAQGSVAASNISPNVFAGVRFHLAQPVQTTEIGGHFVDTEAATFFGAIVELVDDNDFPDSGDLSTPDVLGSTVLTFPVPSNEVFGNLSLSLDPGWYALVFGSELFSTNGDGAAPLNNPDIGSPEYIAFQPGFGWANLEGFLSDFRFVVVGEIVPEPTGFFLMSLASLSFLFRRRSC